MAEIVDRKINEISVETIDKLNTKFLVTSNNKTCLATFDNLKNECNKALAAIYPLITALDNMQNDILQNANNINSINSTIGNVETPYTIKYDIQKNTNGITTLNKTVNTLGDKVDAFDKLTPLTALTTDVDTLIKIQPNLKYISSHVDALELSVDQISSIVTDVSGTAYLIANVDNYGRIRLGFETPTNQKKYPVELDVEGKAYVYVPWEKSEDHASLIGNVNLLTSMSSYYANYTVGGTVSKIPENLNNTLSTYSGYLIDGIEGNSYTPYNVTIPKIIDVVTELSTLFNKIKDKTLEAFPTGSIYCNTTDTDPSTLLKYGTWNKLGSSVVTDVLSELKDNKVLSSKITVYFWQRTA